MHVQTLLNVTMCKHIYLVIRYINSPLNQIPVESSNVSMKSLNVGNKKIFHEVKVLVKYTITAAMKDIQRDMDHLYTLFDQCTDEDILQHVKKNIRAALNLVEVYIIEALSRFNRLLNKPANKALSPQKPFFSTQTHHKTPSTKIAKPTDKQKHELKQSLLLKLQSLNLPNSVIGK